MTFYDSLLDDSVALYSSQTSSNSLGQNLETMTYVESGVSCRLVPTTAEQKITLPGEYQDVSYTMYLDPTKTITHDYQVKFDGNYYKIMDYYIDTESITQKSYLKRVDK